MGKPSKSQLKQQQKEQSVEESQQKEISQSLVQHVPHESQREMQQKLIENILEHASKANPNQKLTWNAVYSIKLKEMELNDEMNQEIEKIKEKYELLKQPIYHQISQAALGHPVNPQLYTPKDLETRIDFKKVKPEKVEHFWGIILDKEGLITQQIDEDCVTKVTDFKCELLSHTTNHLRITFKFVQQTNYFTNRSLQVESRYDSEKNEPVREIKEQLKYKTAVVDHSLFTLLFDSKTDINHFYNVACELYQDYINSLYYYFREEEQDLEDGNQQEVEEEGDKEQEQDEEQSDEEEVKPTKKVKPEIEKPECKNQ